MRAHDAVIVGAGLAGLACALHLTRTGLDVAVLDAADAVGGRVRTDPVDGFLLDRGFQLLNTAYPEARRVLDLDGLSLRSLEASASVYTVGRRFTVAHPLREPRGIAADLRAPLGLRGKVALGRYAAEVAALPVSALRRRPDVPAREAWRRAGIPDAMVEQLLVPFFSGTVLEPALTTSRRYLDLVMRTFVLGRSVVPAAGMRRIPEQLAGALPPGTVRLQTQVERVRPDAVDTGDDAVRARAVVVATDGWSAAALLPGLVEAPRPCGVTTVYHAAERWPEAGATLVVDADRASPVTNTVVISAASPRYAPAGRALVATSLVHNGGVPDERSLRARLARLHCTDTSGWREIGRYDLPRALPAMPAPHPLRRPVRRGSDGSTVYVCGDHCDTGSIQGALVSGRRAAEAVLADLGVTR